MTSYTPEPGDQVLLRGRITDDGTAVVIAPGVELPVRSVRIETDIPKVECDAGRPASFLLLVFANADDRQDFANTFAGWPGAETRDL